MPKRKINPYSYLGLAVVAALVVWFWESPTTMRKGDVVDRSLLENFDFKNVSAIEIEYLLEGSKLKKESEEWKVTELKSNIQKSLEAAETPATPAPTPAPAPEEPAVWFRADKQKIEKAFDILADTTVVSLVGNNPGRHGQFEVNNSGMQLKFFDASGKKLVHLFLGKQDERGMMESCVREEGKNEVYLVNRLLRNIFYSIPEAWRDRVIREIQQVDIQQIEVKRAKNPFTLKRLDGNWKLMVADKPVDVDNAKVEPFVLQLARITATGYEVKETPEMKLATPDVTLLLTMAKGDPYQLNIRKMEKGTDHYAKKEGDFEIYRIADGTVKAIPVSGEWLIATPAKTPETKSTETTPPQK